MKRSVAMRRLLGGLACMVGLFATSMLTTQAAAQGADNACVRAAFEYCSDYDAGTAEFAACVAHYKAVYCPA